MTVFVGWILMFLFLSPETGSKKVYARHVYFGTTLFLIVAHTQSDTVSMFALFAFFFSQLQTLRYYFR